MKEITKQRIKNTIAEAIADGTTAGVNLLVLKDGAEIFYDEQGYADIEQEMPVKRNTIFRLYSMTKPVTAAAAMLLMERGKLDLAQPVAEILPGFRHLTVEKDGKIEPAKTQMNVLHLLNMTSGLTYGDNETVAGRQTGAYIEECTQRLFTDREVTTMEFANHVGTLPLAFEPDSSWRYGLSADVLGAVIEQISGMRFGDFLKENLFEPLQMRDTDFWVPAEKQARLASVYETLEDGTMRLYTDSHLAVPNRKDKRPAYEAGGAGLVSTIDDYARFAQMLLNGGRLGGRQILAPQTVHYLTTGKLTDAQQAAHRSWVGLEGFTYSHLMRIMEYPQMASGLAREGEYGWDGWLGCYFANFPKENMCLLLMQQKKDAGTITMTRKIRNILLADTEIG
ncbi:serine hydrolase domain-containing protein [Marvinbryantia formatexigens]|nr:serine hydrolase domain-containing protein [Marvinbryantia formatexigens]UWO25502.1 beta-lactamase family protein [Marvinbryantia formatexigens DSM 14469]SDG92260.1 CubicO group peptidase, beta-lactamase class C family [Marvinbryantia formatexigens]